MLAGSRNKNGRGREFEHVANHQGMYVVGFIKSYVDECVLNPYQALHFVNENRSGVIIRQYWKTKPIQNLLFWTDSLLDHEPISLCSWEHLISNRLSLCFNTTCWVDLLVDGITMLGLARWIHAKPMLGGIVLHQQGMSFFPPRPTQNKSIILSTLTLKPPYTSYTTP